MTMTDSLGRFFILHNGKFEQPVAMEEDFVRMYDGRVYALCTDGTWH